MMPTDQLDGKVDGCGRGGFVAPGKCASFIILTRLERAFNLPRRSAVFRFDSLAAPGTVFTRKRGCCFYFHSERS